MNRHLFNAMAAQYATPEVSGNGLVSWESGKKCVIPSVRLYGAAVQDGTPTPDAPIMPVCNNGVFVSHGDTILGTTQLNTAEFGWAPNVNSEFDSNAAYYYHEIQAKPNTTYTFIAPYARSGVGTSYFTSICADRNGTVSVQIYNANNAARCNTVGTITTDDTGMLYLVTVAPTGAANALRAFWLTEWGGGQAQAPELWAIPGTEYRDEWDPQTGKGIRRCAVIDSYTGENIDTPFISSTGALTEGAMVVYAIPDTPFTSPPAKLTMPTGYGQIIQVGGDIPDCPITAKYLTHR